jgi:hypothetical protein
VFFYSDRTGLLLSERRAKLEYGSHAPGAPEIFIVDSEFPGVWSDPQRYYLITFEADLPRYQAMVGSNQLSIVAASGGKLLLTNHPLTSSAPLASRASSESD